jgi:hypothetical protein
MQGLRLHETQGWHAVKKIGHRLMRREDLVRVGKTYSEAEKQFHPSQMLEMWQ